MTEQIEMKCCPFCDHSMLRQHAQSRRAKTSGGYHHFVRCPSCHTEGPRSLSSTEEAIALWNARGKIAQFSARGIKTAAF